MRWLILYHDGSVYGIGGGDPYKAPRTGVQAVLREDPQLDEVIIERSPSGYWLWDNGEWLGADAAGFWDHLFHHPSPLVLFGRYIPNHEWQGRMKAQIEAWTGKMKAAWRREEREDIRV